MTSPSGSSSSSSCQSQGYPELVLPHGKKHLHMLGESEAGHKLLRSVLDAFDDFFVTDSAKEKHLSKLRHAADESRAAASQKNVLHQLVNVFPDSDSSLLERLMLFGLNPNVKDFDSATPAHVASTTGAVSAVRTLILCRADPVAEDRSQRTPDDVAAQQATHRAWKKNEYEAIMAAWREVIENGPPSLAQLAAEKKWFAVQNLCRRRVVPEPEKLVTHRKKNAVEWATFHKHTRLVEELQYFFNTACPPVQDQTQSQVTSPIMSTTYSQQQLPPPSAIYSPAHVQPGSRFVVLTSHDALMARASPPSSSIPTGAADGGSSAHAEVATLKKEIAELRKTLADANAASAKREEEWKKEKESIHARFDALEEKLGSFAAGAAALAGLASKKPRLA